MKNRKTVVVAFLLVAAMLLGVGYAAMADTLNINGEGEVTFSNAETAFDEDVYFTKAVSNSGRVGDSASINTENNDKAAFTVKSLQGIGDTATFTFTISNFNAFAVNVKLNPEKTINNNGTYFKMELSETEFDIAAASGDVAGTYEITVTITLLQTPNLVEQTDKVTGTFGVELDVLSVA